MTNMQAAIGLGQLSRIDAILSKREEQNKEYAKLFESTKHLEYRPNKDWSSSVHWLATITLENEDLRDPLIKYLFDNGVEARPMIFPVNFAKPYKLIDSKGDFPISNKISLRSLHLPSSLMISKQQQSDIAGLIESWLNDNC